MFYCVILKAFTSTPINIETTTILSDDDLKANKTTHTGSDEICSDEKTNNENDIVILSTFLNSTDENYEFSIDDDDEELKNIMNMSIPASSTSKKINLFDITSSPGIQIEESPNASDMLYDDKVEDCDTNKSNLTKKVCDRFTYQSTKGKTNKIKIILVIIIQIIFTFYNM